MQVTLPDGRVLTLPIVQFGVMGPPNTGKSQLIATMEKPLLVIATDPRSKLQTYFEQGELDPEPRKGQFGQPIWIVKSFTTGKAIIQIEGFYDRDPNMPSAMQGIFSRLPQAREEAEAGMWKSIALDSWSQLEYVAKQRRTIGPFAKVDSVPAAAADDLEQVLISYLCNMPCHVGLAVHTDQKMIDQGGGAMIYTVKAIGRLKGSIGSNMGEMYRSIATPDATQPTGVKYTLQTQPDGRFDCGTRIGAPNGCDNNFRALFTNWINKRAAIPPTPTPAPAEATTPQEKEKSA